MLTFLLSGCDGDRTERSSGIDSGAKSANSGDELEQASEAATSRPAVVPPFIDVTQPSGLVFRHNPYLSGERYMPEIMGAGVGLLDYDADGDLDVYLVQGAPFESGKTSPSTTTTGDQLFQNQWMESGELRFKNVTVQAEIPAGEYGMGVAIGDVNKDGLPDIYITQYKQDSLLLNQGDGRFEEAMRSARIRAEQWGASAAFVDYDLDGDADLFVSNYVNFDITQNFPCTSEGGQRDYCGPLTYQAVPDQLFENDGTGRFTDVTAKAGLNTAYGAGLGVAVSDFDANGWPDIYVANDGSANQLWMNQGNGRFVNNGLMSGTSLNADGVAEAGMGVMAGDVDNDGDADLFMTHLVAETNTLYLNDGEGSFYDATSEFNLAASSIAMTGFGAGWIDFDLDGRLDLFVANGNVKLETSRIGKSNYPFEQRNQLLWNRVGSNSDMPSFVDVSDTAPEIFEQLEVSRGSAFGDLNNDGAVDIVLTNNNGPARVLLNNTQSTAWLGVELKDAGHRPVSGASITLLSGGKGSDPIASVPRTVNASGSYLSASDKRVVFAQAESAEVIALEVRWPDGYQERWQQRFAAGQYHIIERGTGLAVAEL